MNAVQIITGRGGWPLNCFALPNGKPFYGGTYFRKENWINILNLISQSWETDPQKVNNYAEDLSGKIILNEQINANNSCQIIDLGELRNIVINLLDFFDKNNGGTRGAPKFPLPVNYEFFLHFWWAEGFQPALDITALTLDKMKNGGIYDQIGGGFSRYSVDYNWHVPHFEKMLYDNAQLISLYSKVFQVTGNKQYKEIVSQTIEFVKKEFNSSTGGFYSALDADSEGFEGKYYTWSEKEIDNILDKDSRIFKKYYKVSSPGNWEDTNILYAGCSVEEFAGIEKIELSEIENLLNRCKEKLLNFRQNRIKPGLDDKIITSWNGMMIKALCDAYKAFGKNDYLVLALNTAAFVKEKLIHENFSLSRTYKNNQAKINAFLDDYAMQIDAFIALYEITFNEDFIQLAGKLLEFTNQHFYNAETGLFYYTPDFEEQLIARTTEISDNVIPSSNSVMAFNLFRYGHLMSNPDYIAMSEKMAQSVFKTVIKSPINYMNWLRFYLTLKLPFNELAIIGRNAYKLASRIHSKYNPAYVISATQEESKLPLLRGRSKPGKNLYYICRNHQCEFPVEDENLAISLLNSKA